MKRLRHSLGCWLLRDAPKPTVEVVVDATALNAAIRRLRARRNPPPEDE